ncbi:helix-turn-helix transcriptional regulator [Lentzea sp. NPDC005914]|uniref:helix-turn-helix domain-containing protein n=1 Tax=Lentzea sp. NPDC005914 TaxID=3154572 RepID=UPI0033F2B927
MTRDPSNNELGDFLKARRSELSPADVGLPADGAARRVAGLRREEVAMLAAISTDYYTRLEQGRIHASPSVLASLAQVLRLDSDQRAYLHDLAGRRNRHPDRRPAGYHADRQLQRMLDDMTHTPAFVIGPLTEIVAWNAMGAALITDFAKIPGEPRYYIRMLFTDPAMRDLYADWEGVTRLAIAQMRMHNAAHPGDPRLTALVGELSAEHPLFRQWWADHQVATRGTGTKHLHHPVVGDLILDWNAVTWAADPNLQIIVWTAEADSSSHDGLRLLAAWTADRAARTTGAKTG